jgi:L-aminopeptidase/D-esterase-like protein
MIQPGPRNLITDVPGLLVGNAEDRDVRTGVTVVLPEAGALVAAVDVRGGASGTRNTAALETSDIATGAHGIVLSGGSEFGLAAADGAVQWLSAHGRGLDLGPRPIPVTAAAILFDLRNGGDKGWVGESPYRRLGVAACEAAGLDFALGTAGAGYGAQAGRLKGGLGSASVADGSGLVVGALVAVNSVGSITMPGSAAFWAWPFELDGEFGGVAPPSAPISAEDLMPFCDAKIGGNTTIGVIATNAKLDRQAARRVAIMAQDGYARAMRPSHTPFDGDTVFALATGTIELEPAGPMGVAKIGAMAADCMARAVARGVYEATAINEVPSYRDRYGKPAKR